LKLAGEIAKPGSPPTPTSSTVNGEFEASLVRVKPPEAEPADSGANWIWIVLVWPGAIVAEGVPAPVVKLAPVTAVRSMVTVEVPVFVTVTLCVVVLPTPTVPKLTVVRLADSMPVLIVFAGLFALV
jgi:hypothetical protein